MRYRHIVVHVARTRVEYEAEGTDFETECDTLKQARERARYVLTAQYARNVEMSEPYGFSAIIADGKLLEDFES